MTPRAWVNTVGGASVRCSNDKNILARQSCARRKEGAHSDAAVQFDGRTTGGINSHNRPVISV
jgi:hypothetical protein